MFTQLKSLTEASVPGKYVNVLTNKAGKILGYYVSDDKRLCVNPAKALAFNSKVEAQRDAKLSNAQWDIPRDQKFVPMLQSELEILKKVLTEANEYDSSIDFEADASELEELLKKAAIIVNKREWSEWMGATDSNFGTSKGNAEDLSGNLEDAIDKAKIAFKTLYNHMVAVGEN